MLLKIYLIKLKALILHQVYYSTKNNISRLAELFIWPLYELSIWGFFSLQFKNMTSSGLVFSFQFFLGALFLWSFIRRLQEDICSSVLVDINSRNFKNFLITPITIFDLSFSLLISSLLKYLFSFLMIFLVTLLLFKFNIFIFLIKVFPFAVSLIIFGWVLGIFGLSLIFATGGRMMVISGIISLIIQPFSCVFYAREILPGIFKTISYFLPISYVFESLRDLISNNYFSRGDLLFSFLLNFIYAFLVILFLRWMYFLGRKRGKFIEI